MCLPAERSELCRTGPTPLLPPAASLDIHHGPRREAPAIAEGDCVHRSMALPHKQRWTGRSVILLGHVTHITYVLSRPCPPVAMALIRADMVYHNRPDLLIGGRMRETTPEESNKPTPLSPPHPTLQPRHHSRDPQAAAPPRKIASNPSVLWSQSSGNKNTLKPGTAAAATGHLSSSELPADPSPAYDGARHPRRQAEASPRDRGRRSVGQRR